MMAGVGQFTGAAPEVAAIGILTMLAFQKIKQHPRINQNVDQCWILPAIALLIGLLIFVTANHGDWLLAVSKAISNSGIAALDAAFSYKTVKPLGILGPAADFTPSAA